MTLKEKAVLWDGRLLTAKQLVEILKEHDNKAVYIEYDGRHLPVYKVSLCDDGDAKYLMME